MTNASRQFDLFMESALRKSIEGGVKTLICCELRPLKFSDELKQLASEQNFHLDGYKFEASPEQLRSPRLVKVAGIQNGIVDPTDAPIQQQRDSIHKRVGQLIEAAGKAGANIICMQEVWSRSIYFLC